MRYFPREGVLQVATGKRHRDEVIAVSERIRPYLNGRPITLVTDNVDYIPMDSLIKSCFTASLQTAIAIRYCLF